MSFQTCLVVGNPASGTCALHVRRLARIVPRTQLEKRQSPGDFGQILGLARARLPLHGRLLRRTCVHPKHKSDVSRRGHRISFYFRRPLRTCNRLSHSQRIRFIAREAFEPKGSGEREKQIDAVRYVPYCL
jgi:hypothetical protein